MTRVCLLKVERHEYLSMCFLNLYIVYEKETPDNLCTTRTRKQKIDGSMHETLDALDQTARGIEFSRIQPQKSTHNF